MADRHRRRLRTTFTEDAELYDRVRSGYPPELFDDLAELTTVGKDRRVLEIGCGTAQATVPLAWRGCHVVAVELGEQMVGIAQATEHSSPSYGGQITKRYLSELQVVIRTD
jgi:SAM-dependent methyltransferase